MSRSAIAAAPARLAPRADALGYPAYLFIVWLALEYGRPPNPMKIPYLISIVFLVSWLIAPRKIWRPQIVASLAFVAQMVVMIPFAENNFAARMVAREVFTIVVCIAVPVAHLIKSLREYEVILRSWVVIFLYMAIIALMNGGSGPGGAAHGVDENYTALFMCVAVSNIYFISTVTKSRFYQICLYIIAVACIAAIVLGFSRGGFVGFVLTAGYCWWESPAKWKVLAAIVLLSPLGLPFVPEEYWSEMNTIGDTSEATADRRLVLWGIATQIFLDNPIFGAGPGNFVWVSGMYQAVDEQGVALGMNVTHSLYFELIAEMGTLGIIVWLTLIVCNYRDLRWVGALHAREQRRLARLGLRDAAAVDYLAKLRRARAYAGGMGGATVGFFVCSAFLSTTYYTTYWLITAFIVALREVTRREQVRFAQAGHRASDGPDDPGASTPIPCAPVDEPARGSASLSGLLGGAR